MNRSEAIETLAEALAKAQFAFLPVKQSAKVDYATNSGRKKYAYAPLSEVLDACRKALADNGLAIVQLLSNDDDKVVIETSLLHKSGQWLSSTFGLKPVSLDPQAVGSIITYLRRYALSALLGVASEEDDDAESVKSEKATGEMTGEKPVADTTEHYCGVHKTKFFMKGKMRSYAHPIGDTGEWCYEAAIKPAPAPTLPESHKDGTEVVAGQDAPKYKTDPSTLKSYQDLCNACFKDFKVDDGKGHMIPMQPADIVKELGLQSKSEIADIPDAYRKIARVRK